MQFVTLRVIRCRDKKNDAWLASDTYTRAYELFTANLRRFQYTAEKRNVHRLRNYRCN